MTGMEIKGTAKIFKNPETNDYRRNRSLRSEE